MNDYKITQQVKRKSKRFAKPLSIFMVVMAVVLVILAIIFDTGLMLPAFLFAVLYYIFCINTDREYEYCLKNGVLTIAVIRGKRRRKTAHTLMMQDMEVIAPNWHEAVAKYRKNGGTEKLKRFDYTSYDDNIPYYTMIVYENKEKIKLLLDLNDSMLEAVKRVYPQKVYMR
nr:YwiC-like family protein [Eubacterium ramulus]